MSSTQHTNTILPFFELVRSRFDTAAFGRIRRRRGQRDVNAGKVIMSRLRPVFFPRDQTTARPIASELKFSGSDGC